MHLKSNNPTPMVLRLRSTGACIGELEKYIKTLFDEFNLAPDLYPNILISLTEAVNNAIKHGNENDQSKAVLVRSIKNGDKVYFVVTDEGEGFDHSSLPDPTAPENLEKPGGRGVFLMRQLSDKVRFLNNGSTVEIEFQI